MYGNWWSITGVVFIRLKAYFSKRINDNEPSSLKILRYLRILYIAYNHMQSCECKTMTHGYRKIAFSKYYRCVHVFEVIFKSLFLRIIRVITIQKKLFEKNFFFSSTHFVTLYQTNNNSSNLLVYVEAGF